MKSILITGVNGFLGSHLAKYLKHKYNIIGLANKPKKLHRISDESFKVYFFSDEDIEKIFIENNIYTVIHAATVYDSRDDNLFSMIACNIILPMRLIELCNRYSTSCFINTDSFFNNDSYNYSYMKNYTMSKRHILKWLIQISHNSSCKIVNMVIFHMYGENDSINKFIPNIIKLLKDNQDSIDLTPGDQIRDFIYIKDVVNAYNKVLDSIDELNSYQSYEVGYGEGHSIKKLVSLMKSIINSKTKLKFGSLNYREGEIMNSQVLNFKLRKLGWTPKYKLKDGLKEYIVK